MFRYNADKQAYIKDATAGTFQQLVLAAGCPVDLEAELHGEPAALALDDRVAVSVQVVPEPRPLVRVLHEAVELPEVVHVLGEADLVDPSLQRPVDVPLDGLDRVVDRLVRRAKVHVVVDDQSQEATSSRSAGVVTFRSRGSPSTASSPPAISGSEVYS